jgi:phosphate starvation-inducible PhoH-like protein
MSKSKRLRKAATLDGAVQDNSGSSATGADKSSYIHQNDKLRFDIHVTQRHDLTENQQKLIDLILDKKTKMVFVSGPAGTSKTFLAVYAGLLLLQKRSMSDILYIRSIAESASKSLGSLPGEMDDKLSPFLMPLRDKLDELLPRPDVDKLLKEKRVEALPIGYLRGASFNARFIISDESQNLDRKELTTLVTRLGEFSKMIVLGDASQSDINGKSGFMTFFDTFNDETSRQNGIHCFSFTKDDIVRSGILRYIVERLETMPKPPSSH